MYVYEMCYIPSEDGRGYYQDLGGVVRSRGLSHHPPFYQITDITEIPRRQPGLVSSLAILKRGCDWSTTSL
jgi:hypothetical protein